jgi:chaperonin GroEL
VNAGSEGSIVAQTVRAGDAYNYGYNAATDKYEDLMKSGVIDPTKVVTTALRNAASVAILLLTTEALISVVPDKKKKGGGGGPSPDMEDMDMDY